MITQAITASFRAQMLLGVHDFRPSAQPGASIFKIALYTSLANIDANTPAYTPLGEVVGSGYTPGGMALTNLGATTVNINPSVGMGFINFMNAAFLAVTVSARGALVYNTTPKANDNNNNPLVNPSVFILDFGSDKVVVGGTFLVAFPLSGPLTAIMRFA